MGLKLKTWCAPRGYQRADDMSAAFEAALQPALRDEVDLVIHSGDVFDRSKPPPQAIEATVKLLQRAARHVPVVIMPGNHDRHGLLGNLAPGPNLHIVDGPTQVRIHDLVLGMVPYVREAGMWASDAAIVAPGADLLVCHQSFHGARVPGFTFRVGHHRETVGEQHLPRRCPPILCGHIHPRQVTHLRGVAIVQPGSSERTSFSEARQTKGSALWELGRKPTWSWVDLPTRPMHKVITEADAQAVRPGGLVLMDKRAPVDLAELVVDRGGFFASRRPRRVPDKRTDQLALFG